MKKSSSVSKRLLGRLALSLVSFLFVFSVLEFALRIFYPKYEYAAESQYDRNSIRIWSRRANTRYYRRHPDTERIHAVYHNNLGLRQHRNFSSEDLRAATNLGFFGDSFAENQRLPSQYSFSEPLDYLLNRAGKAFNVLNFGVDGYGPDQSFLYYQQSADAVQLDYVFYLFCVNDIRNIYENELFSVGPAGTLVRNPSVESPAWLRLFSRLHLSYFLLDFSQRLFSKYGDVNRQVFDEWYSLRHQRKRFRSSQALSIEHRFVSGEGDAELRALLSVFDAVLRQWKSLVEQNGARFIVVLLPRPEENGKARIFFEDYEVLNLYEKIAPSGDTSEPGHLRFIRDGHWNESANLLSALEFYRFVENQEKLAPLSPERLVSDLTTYYSAFPNGWMPESQTQSTASTKILHGIQMKYLALELQTSGKAVSP